MGKGLLNAEFNAELIQQVIESTEKELQALKDFADNEGHMNAHVMLAVCVRISDLEGQLKKLVEEKRKVAIADRLVEGATLRHYKGGLYTVMCRSTHTETGEEMVVYKRVSDGSEWVRPLHMFFDTVEYEGQTVKRFIV